MNPTPISLAFFLISFLCFTQAKEPKRQVLACVGDSITQGVGAERGQSWPAQAQRTLGEKWQVQNFGLSGTTLMNSGNKPYQKSKQFKAALSSNPDIVVIMLGTNDTKPANWRNSAKDYEVDYRDLISDFEKLPSKPKIYLCLPPYIAKEGRWGINNQDTLAQIPMIKKIAKDLKLEVIDVYAALEGQDDLIPDTVHPNTGGAALIAKAVAASLTTR
ncbi:GDSL-type esterase/lipase family protein [Akkermansiaceae bacterium]|jgi:lysophospholipase L1-like esterase|nr:sialate O-acetylesterase [Verrucomicrobiota bacterium]MDA7516643.1 GDSL-type esterase/lipase family protein [Akkermansiaceae bacterium]MDB4660846.1 GDSL-type esterase/lipase family protein [bacterium]MBT7214831.1 sialate O-acetylesterase [Verrucomicrobiota bacterium]MDA7606901.1 GDSL-type esterase/lipase family protein [Akkermansiaceae bacterium]